ncbi:DUF368 domain-containing protein [Paenibacillus sp. IB182496]|uniref:DUF368 domain-containing protein n=1 Tax=Paenibacillus sabuli TaxID=2772509 RepID=A0A927BQ61_9BACL|nr:DUF368 domain-containing protein [Paenibacillus sabuli]MBD2843906.1 DUF368 domain-containing protein [Paenibacillus sabuli]
MEWRNLYRGVLMGISDLIPGVSGGTIAVVLGIYDRLLQAISGFFSRQWKRHIGFLLPLAAGMGAAIVSLSRVIEYVLAHYFAPTQFFFIGLIIGVLPLITRQAGGARGSRPAHLLVLLVAAVLLGLMALVNGDEHGGEPLTDPDIATMAGLFFSGWLASMAMLLPGISGSLVLLLLGVYPTAIYALSNLDLMLMALIGSGVIIGFIVSSKAIRYLLQHYARITHAAIIGLLIGSVAVIFPGIPREAGTIAACVVTLLCGLGIAYGFGAADRKRAAKGEWS